MSLFGGKRIMSVELSGTYVAQEENALFQISNLLIDYFIINWSKILFFTFLTMLIVNALCIPLYKIFKKNIPPQEAKPSYIELSFLCFVVGILFCYHVLVDVGKAQTLPIKIIGEDILDPQIDEEEESSLIKKGIVETYIIRCRTEVISFNEWDDLSNDDLYYIRNGIFADCGQWFESGYYDEFSWYNPKYSSVEVWNYIGHCQRKNIDNIGFIEDQRE